MSDVVYRIGMKRKSIKKVLREKIDEWLESIEDESVRALAKRDVIVTGGSIASMLLGEKINDFDIYFKTKDTTKYVADYYVKKFNQVAENKQKTEEHVTDIRPYVVEDEVTGKISIYIKSSGIAAADNEGSYNYFEMAEEGLQDSYLESVKEALEVNQESTEKGLYRPIFLSENAITLSNKIQIVIRFYGNPDEIHENYDFVHAMNYYTRNEDELVLKTEALESLMSRTLIYKGSLFPICSLIRARKFINRRWRISAGQLLKMAFQISELDLTDQKVLKEQLTGVDQAYFHQLLEAIKDTDPEKINSAYVSEIIDRVFGEN